MRGIKYENQKEHEFICPNCSEIHSNPEFNEFCSLECMLSVNDSYEYDEFGFELGYNQKSYKKRLF